MTYLTRSHFLRLCLPAAVLLLLFVATGCSSGQLSMAMLQAPPTATWEVPANWQTATPTPQPTAEPTPIPAPTATPMPLGYFAPEGREFGTLDDFWEGSAEWVIDIHDVGLPLGESDTVQVNEHTFWSYLHASNESSGVVDSCGDPVPFPGCTTLWTSLDAGRSFQPHSNTCLFKCTSCPCDYDTDHTDQQQYPRVAFTDLGNYLVYENGAATYLRQSADGLNWSAPTQIPGTGNANLNHRPCEPYELIGEHPFIYSEFEADCLAGGPPGLFIEGDLMVIFVAMGKSPGSMGCYIGSAGLGIPSLRPCRFNPLFSAEATYGPLDLTGPAANPYFGFRILSSADLLRVGEHVYMVYEGVRGPSSHDVVDNQFGLGLARSVGPQVDGPWETYAGNPIVMDLPGNVGVGHADLVQVGDATYLYTATSDTTRGRYVLVKK